MVLALDIVLPFGRYCATPWGRHVNEGAVEWPPSPWRVTRALVASWHIHHPQLAEAEVVQSLDALCGAPSYHLPAHTVSTTRHYMPDSKDRRSKRSTGLGLNPFVAVSPGASMRIIWNRDTDDVQLQTLQRLASTVTYLGRAESRVVMSVFMVDACSDDCVRPLAADVLSSAEVLDLLVPTSPLDLDSMHTTTGMLHNSRRNTPSGTSWVSYPAPRPAVAPTPTPQRRQPAPTQIMVFALSGRGRPSMVNTALLAGFFRSAVTGRAPDHPQLHGHTGDSRADPRADGHRHAHFLATNDLSRGQRVDRLVLWTPEGIPPDAVGQLAKLTSLCIPDHLQRRLGSQVGMILEQVGTTRLLDPRLTDSTSTWTSVTPVTTRRHRKRHESPADFIDDVVRRELSYRGLPSEANEVRVTAMPDNVYPGPLQARRIYRARSLGRSRQHVGFHVRLDFVESVQGPLVLGSLSHFGLGLFVNVRQT